MLPELRGGGGVSLPQAKGERELLGAGIKREQAQGVLLGGGVCCVGHRGKAVVVRCIGLGSCYWLEQGVGLNHRW